MGFGTNHIHYHLGLLVVLNFFSLYQKKKKKTLMHPNQKSELTT